MISLLLPPSRKNRRGHRGNDGDYGWIYTVDQQVGPHLMTEDGDGVFTLYLYPTTAVEDDHLFVDIVCRQ